MLPILRPLESSTGRPQYRWSEAGLAYRLLRAATAKARK
jgi:hypothetical protein